LRKKDYNYKNKSNYKNKREKTKRDYEITKSKIEAKRISKLK